MGRRWRVTRLVLALTLLVAIAGAQAASAQPPGRGNSGGTEPMSGSLIVEPIQTYTDVTNPLTTSWKSNRNRTRIEYPAFKSAISVVETRDAIEGQFWSAGDELSLQQDINLDLRYVPDLDSDSSGMVTRTSRVEVSGRTSGQLSWFVPDVGDEVIVGSSALNWDAKIDGSGECLNDECTIRYVMTGPLSGDRSQGNCGELSVTAMSDVNIDDNVRGFKSVSGMDIETEVMDFWSAELKLATARDGSTCFIGETEKNLLGSRVTFYHGRADEQPGDLTLNEPDILRVMPGDNVKIIGYRDVPMQISQVPSDGSDQLWNPEHGPLTLTQDLLLEVRYTPDRSNPENGTVIVAGDVNGVFPKEWTLPNGLIAEGSIAGRGVCTGNECQIQLVRTLEILQPRNRNSCGSLTLSESVHFLNADNPELTFDTGGTGSMTLRNHQHCVLDTFESLDDV
jgi:hypothetical protein